MVDGGGGGGLNQWTGGGDGGDGGSVDVTNRCTLDLHKDALLTLGGILAQFTGG